MHNTMSHRLFFQKVGCISICPVRLFMCLCLLWTALCLPGASMAQQPSTTGYQALSLIQNGNLSGASQLLQQNISASSGINATQVNTIVSNISRATGMNPSSAVSLMNGLTNGNISGALGQTLSSISNLGNINSIQGLSTVLSSPQINSLVSQLTTGSNLASQTAQLLRTVSGLAVTAQTISQIISNPAALVNTLVAAGANALVNALTGSISNLIPSLATQAIAATAVGNALQGLTGTNTSNPGSGEVTTSTTGTLNNRDQCSSECPDCCLCHVPIVNDHISMRSHVVNELEKHRSWIVVDYFVGNGPQAGEKQYGILPALKLMTEQLTTVGMQQVHMIGTFLDAKHQLETQRLFQVMTAQAHKDYHPSEGLCEIGTNVRSLLPSQRRSDLVQTAFAERVLDRTLLSGNTSAVGGSKSDKRSRLDHFIKTYCDTNDNAGTLGELCAGGGASKERMNKDVDFTRTLEIPLTLDIDFANGAKTNDSEDVMALTANLIAHDVPQLITKSLLGNDKGEINRDAVSVYLDVRALAAKRSVAQNSLSALTALKAKGSDESAPYLKRWVKEMGVPDAEIEKYLGDKPSYFAQMEVLSKKIYQNPAFYADLYDKPVNVERKAAALEAIGLMQDRDIYRSLLRSEMVLAVFLDTLLEEEQNKLAEQFSEISKESTKSTGTGVAP